MGILISGGKVVTSVDTYYADVRIENDKIRSIGSELGKIDDEIIDAHGCYIIPGGIDTHTHFALNVGTTITADDFESGTKAAIVGGTTTIIDYATQNKGESLKEALHAQHEKSDGVCYCDYGFHMGITDWNDEVELEMEDMIKEGVTSFKLYMAYKGNLQVDDGVILKALKKSRETKTLLCFHCENGDVIDELINEAKTKGHISPYYHVKTRPVEAEREAITRLLNFSEIMDTTVYIVHLSSREGLLSILDAKKRGVKVFVETCPQYLLLNDLCYGEEKSDSFAGAKYVISPPLRKGYDQEALWKGISQGEITTIGSDHCSFNYKGQKDIGINDFTKIPNGAPGVENRMGLIYTYGVVSGKISINEMVAITSTNAAKTFGIFPQKGTIAVGSDADIVVWDPNSKSYITAVNQTQKVDYNPYEGFNQQGRVLHEFLRGNKVISNGELVEKGPIGKYIFRKINK
ncbi:dihydropyrimidinase [Clostridium estertheticum]|uniref:dihydropyrimidinase n=1 Tax=Clostridium estertheticum TaxID=238834 RepID=UPI001C0AB867|nr:dihydropyrimidinase [Clostridium estertheticum]MBU3217955.1 dihydropyrimidinase [Clostridium estertheticum]WAG54180.1 dihydropyrimidinase [Clostridium estertheticum]